MNPLIETLAALQVQMDRAAKPATPEQRKAMEALRADLPTSVVTYFDRLVGRGRKAVSWVRNGVCSSCHLRVAVGTVASLQAAPHVVMCEHCGSYLALEPNEAAKAAASGTSRLTAQRVTRSEPALAEAVHG